MKPKEQFDYLFKIVIVGDSGVGKTNLLSQFVEKTFNMDSKPTIGVEFLTKTLNLKGKIIKNQIWDTAGQQRFRSLTSAYYKGAQGAVIVFDLSKYLSFDNTKLWLQQLRKYAMKNVIVMLIGNKLDLQIRNTKKQVIEEFVKTNQLLYMETSALSGKNVEESFNILAEEIYEKIVFEQSIHEKQIDVNDIPSPEKKTIYKKNESVEEPLQKKQKQAEQKIVKLDNGKSKGNEIKKKNKSCC